MSLAPECKSSEPELSIQTRTGTVSVAPQRNHQANGLGGFVHWTRPSSIESLRLSTSILSRIAIDHALAVLSLIF